MYGKRKVCNRGAYCKFLQQGRCNFYHPEVEQRSAVMKDSATIPSCPLCSTEMIKKMGNNEFWACPRYPDCKGTKPIAEFRCEDCGAGMVKRNGEWGSFWGCSRYPACRKMVTKAQREKQLLATKPIKELEELGMLSSLKKDRLEDFLREQGLSTSGDKSELILRIRRHFHPPTPEELAKEEEENQRRIEEAKRLKQAMLEKQKQQELLAKQQEQAEDDQWQNTLVVPTSRYTISDFPHSASSIFPQHHEPSRYDCFGRSDKKLDSLPTVSDFAVGLSENSLNAKIVFYAPKQRKVLALLTDLTLRKWLHLGQQQVFVDEIGKSTLLPLLDYFHCTGGRNGGTKKNPSYWTEIFEQRNAWIKPVKNENEKAEESAGTKAEKKRKLDPEENNCEEYVCIIHRDGAWTDAEWDWDVSGYIPRSHGGPMGRVWAFRVPTTLYTAAWESLAAKVHPLTTATTPTTSTTTPTTTTTTPLFMTAEPPLTAAEVKRMKVPELKLALKQRGQSPTGRKAELVERLMSVAVPVQDSNSIFANIK